MIFIISLLSSPHRFNLQIANLDMILRKMPYFVFGGTWDMGHFVLGHFGILHFGTDYR